MNMENFQKVTEIIDEKIAMPIEYSLSFRFLNRRGDKK